MSVHIDLDELADAAAGALDRDRTQTVARHVDGCPTCAQNWAALAEVSRRLAEEPSTPMPPDVAARLAGVVAEESRRRSSAAEHQQSPSWHKPPLGAFGSELPPRSRRRTAGHVLAACAAATTAGFGGYLLSASAGLNEPSAATPAVISSSQLGRQAAALQRATDVDPHRFSKAWRCARQVTPGRITGVTSATVDGRPALLVYSDRDQTAVVTVVTGCAEGAPAAGPSTTVPR